MAQDETEDSTPQSAEEKKAQPEAFVAHRAVYDPTERFVALEERVNALERPAKPRKSVEWAPATGPIRYVTASEMRGYLLRVEPFFSEDNLDQAAVVLLGILGPIRYPGVADEALGGRK